MQSPCVTLEYMMLFFLFLAGWMKVALTFGFSVDLILLHALESHDTNELHFIRFKWPTLKQNP
jgi:hypothetical protein